jgi:surface protein
MFSTSPIVSIPTASTWDVSRVTNMAYLFKDCANLIGLDVSKWNVSNVTDMGAAFQNCTRLQSIDLSKWELKKSVTINSLLDGASLINNISIRENTVLGNANYAFRDCPLEHFSAPNLKITGQARGMFYGAGNGGVLDLTSWDMSECTSIKGWGDGMFASSKFDEINIAGWDLVNKGIAETNANGGNLFTNCTARKINLTGCNTKGLVGLAAFLSGCSNLDEVLGFSDLDLSSVTTIAYMIGKVLRHFVAQGKTCATGVLLVCSQYYFA